MGSDERQRTAAQWLNDLFLDRPAKFHTLIGVLRGPDQAAVDARKIFVGRARFFLYSGAKHGHEERKAPFLSYEDISRVVRELKGINSSVARSFMHRAKHGLRVLAGLPSLSRAEREEIGYLVSLADLLLKQKWVEALSWHDSYPWKREELG
jgi:hypothetical protein